MTPDGAGSGLPRLRVVPTAEVSPVAAELIATALAAAVEARGEAHWATTGGSAAPGIYAALATPPLRDRVPWHRVHTWWGDDRFVPYDHPDSNVLPFEAGLLAIDEPGGGSRGPHIHADHIHRIPIPEALAAAEGPAGAAARYEAALRSAVPLDDDGVPVLDLMVVGVGPDGHVLSVFPGSAVWDAPGLAAGVPAPAHVGPHVERVTLHPRLLAAARAVLVVTTGASKAERLAQAWTGDDARELPVRAARLPSATWLVDEAAAAGLPRG